MDKINNVAWKIAHVFEQTYLDNPDILVKIESFYSVQGKKALIEHSGYNQFMVNMQDLIKKCLTKDDVNVEDAASSQAKRHIEASVGHAAFIEACMAMEDFVRDTMPESFPRFLKNSINLKKRVDYYYDSIMMDIQNELKETSKYWNEIFENTTEPTAVVDENGKLYDVNEALLRQLGYSKEEMVDPNFNWIKTSVHPKDVDQMLQGLNYLFSIDEPLRFRLNLYKKDRTKVPTLSSFKKLVKRKAWEKNRMVVSVTDITGFKKEERELKDVIAAFGDVLRKAATGNVETKVDLTSIPERYEPIAENINLMIEETKKRQEALVKTKKGLEDTKSYYEEIFQHSSEGMTVFDKDGRVYEANNAAINAIGYTMEEVYDPDFNWIEAITKPKDRDLAMEQISMLFTMNEPLRIRRNFVKKDGSIVPTLSSFTKLTRRQGWEKDRMVITIMDITELKKEEAELKHVIFIFGDVLENAAQGKLTNVVLNQLPDKYRPIGESIKTMIEETLAREKELKETKEKLKELLKVQKETIKELSTPIIPVWKNMLMLPLIGTFDSNRMRDLQENALNAVSESKPKIILMDLSGLFHVNTNIVGEIAKLIKSLQLLGTKTILVGIKPGLAQTLIRIGADLKGIITCSTLEQGLQRAVRWSLSA